MKPDSDSEPNTSIQFWVLIESSVTGFGCGGDDGGGTFHFSGSRSPHVDCIHSYSLISAVVIVGAFARPRLNLEINIWFFWIRHIEELLAWFSCLLPCLVAFTAYLFR